CDQHIDTTQFRDAALHQRGDLPFDAGVDLVSEPFAAERAHLGSRFFSTPQMAIGDANIRALFRKTKRGGPSDAARAASDQCILSLQSQAHSCSSPVIARARFLIGVTTPGGSAASACQSYARFPSSHRIAAMAHQQAATAWPEPTSRFIEV